MPCPDLLRVKEQYSCEFESRAKPANIRDAAFAAGGPPSRLPGARKLLQSSSEQRCSPLSRRLETGPCAGVRAVSQAFCRGFAKRKLDLRPPPARKRKNVPPPPSSSPRAGAGACTSLAPAPCKSRRPSSRPSKLSHSKRVASSSAAPPHAPQSRARVRGRRICALTPFTAKGVASSGTAPLPVPRVPGRICNSTPFTAQRVASSGTAPLPVPRRVPTASSFSKSASPAPHSSTPCAYRSSAPSCQRYESRPPWKSAQCQLPDAPTRAAPEKFRPSPLSGRGVQTQAEDEKSTQRPLLELGGGDARRS